MKFTKKELETIRELQREVVTISRARIEGNKRIETCITEIKKIEDAAAVRERNAFARTVFAA